MARAQIADIAVVLNTIRATATSAYQTAVPLATAANIKDVGKAVFDSADVHLINEFMSGLNKIALTMIDSMEYTNPLMFLKKGKVEYGASIEHIFVEMAKPSLYVAGTRTGDDIPDQFAISKVANKAAWYVTQLERQYFATIHDDDIRRAFTSSTGVGDFVGKVYGALRSGEQYDDYRTSVALMARQIQQGLTESPSVWKGEVKLITLFNATVAEADQVTAATALSSKLFLTFMANMFKKWSNRLAFPRSDLNFASVVSHVPVSKQRIMMLGDIQADLDTNLFAWAYNEERLQIGGFDQIDAWYSIGMDNASPTPQSLPDKIDVKSLVAQGQSKVLAVIYDPDMVKIYNKKRTSEVARNARGHYFNTFVTVGDFYACSPFHNFVVFTLE